MIECVGAPTAADFARRWVRPALPVVIRGAIEDWPARTLWSADYLKRELGARSVPVGRTRHQLLVHDAKSGIAYDELRLDQYLDRPQGYAIAVVEERLPELAHDVRRLSFAPNAPWTLRKLWLSGAGTRSPLHQDLTENLFAQVVGRKQVTLFSPADSRNLYRYPLHSQLPQFSRVDVDAPDHGRFPRFRRARPLTLVLEPGDVLYIPRLWWHRMRSLDFSLSVSDWWATGAVYWAVRAALLYKKLRQLRY